MSSGKVVTFPSRAAELEYRIRALATSYRLGEPCIDPVTGLEVPDPEFDDLVDELRTLDPTSSVFDDVEPVQCGLDPNAKVVKHDPPMTSISKANGTEIAKAEALAHWIADCLDELDYMKRVATAVFEKSHDTPYHVFVAALKHRGYEFDPERFAEWFSLLYKRDGVACRLYYKNGKLVAAGLRPRNGVDGEDITENIRHVKGVPLEIGDGFTGAVQGELYCLRSVFERKNREMMASGQIKAPFANERNYTTGSIRQFKEPGVTAEREIAFVTHGMAGLETHHGFYTEYERAKWLATQGFEVVRVSKFNFETLAKLEETMPTLDYLVDGVVIKVSNLHDQEELGNHGGKATGNPRGAIAWKFRDETAETTLREIVAQVGRTGGLTPVLEFPTVRLAGTNVDRATGHNITFLALNGIKPGVVLGIKKSGMIIPAVEYVVVDGKPRYTKDVDEAYHARGVEKLTVADIEPYVYAKTCPSCNHATDITEGATGNFELICPNNLCPAQAVRTFAHFLKVMGVKGIGEAILNKLVASGLSSPADFYKYDIKDLEEAGLSKRESLLALAAIHGIKNPSQVKKNEDLTRAIITARATKRKVPIWQIFASLGIYGAGETVGKSLQAHFRDLDKIRHATPEEFSEVEGIGATTAKVIWEFFQEHGDVIDDLALFLEPEEAKSGKFDGMTFCLSGGFTPNKNYWKNAIESEGGVCKDSFGRNLTYLVEGDDAGSKVQKAKSAGVKVISAAELERMLQR